MKKLFTLLLGAGIVFTANAQSTTVVISKVYSGGGSSVAGTTYKKDYVEIHNISNAQQDISGFSLQYGSATGIYGNSANQIFEFPANTLMPAGGYLLIELGSVGTAGADITPTPDFTTTNLSMSASASSGGKVALVNSATGLGCSTCGTNASIIDRFGWGTANDFEGTVSPVLSGTTTAVRKNNGCTESDNNVNDFDIVNNTATPPTLNNASSPAVNCTSMPITFGAYNLSVVNNTVAINWETKFEQNVNEFSVERSANGTEFSTIGTVAATNKVEGSKYNFTDVNPIEGVSYYRIKSTDFDGKTSYTKTLVANTKKTAGIKLFGNPVRNNIVLSHDKAARGSVIRIYNSIGSLLQTINVQEGATQTSGDVSKLISGSYLAIFEANGVKQNVQFVKQ